MLNPFITSNPENKSLVIEVTCSKFWEYSFFWITNFFDKALGIINPKTPNMEIKITIVGLMENRTTREIINDIKHDITWNKLLKKLSSIIFRSLYKIDIYLPLLSSEKSLMSLLIIF